jgi:GTPase
VRIEQVIFVARERHKRRIALGHGGRRSRRSGRRRARRSPRRFLDCKVHLFLFVKVRENWIDDPARYREMGLEFEGGG